MLTYLKNEDEFKKQLGTEDVPKDFKNLNIRASSYINFNTHGRIDVNNIQEEVKYATCLIINLLDKEDTKISQIGNLKSQNIEGWSESYSTPEEIKTDYEDKKQKVLNQYLWNVIGTDGNPLLYCGVC